MQVVAICQELGWTYEEYQNQPEWFVDLLKDKLDIDAEESRKASKK